MTLLAYGEFQIETFEAGRGLWHARAHRTDGKPVLLDGIAFSELHVGFSWPTVEQALVDAQDFLQRLSGRLTVG